MAYPAGCYNLAKMLMTGKGGVQYNRIEAYQLLDRGCRGGHGGSCYLQAQILCARPGTLGPNIPHDPYKAMELYDYNCKELGDSIRYVSSLFLCTVQWSEQSVPLICILIQRFYCSCFTLATMLLRGDKVNREADNVSPQEARGQSSLMKRENEPDRARTDVDPYAIPRDPARAAHLLKQACDRGVTSCHNLAVMYLHGDDGVEPDEEKAEHYKKMTKEKINIFGGF
jgi:TPR repeat protein